MTNPPGSFIWYELITPDLDGARAFYKAVAGLEIPAEPAPGPMDYRMIGTPGGGTVGGALRLDDEMKASGMQPVWLGYIYVPDVDAAAARIKAAGGAVHMTANVPNAGRIAMVNDAQGVIFYIMTPTPPEGDGDKASTVFDPEKPGHVAWNELHAKDGVAAFDFYADQFGWEKSEAMDMGPMGIYQMFRTGGDDAVGGMMSSPNMPHPLWVYYFNVADIDEALTLIEASGGKLLYGPGEIPGGFFIIQAFDPQGALFAVVGPRKQA